MRGLFIVTLMASATITTIPVLASKDHEHSAHDKKNTEAITVTGEILDMACYIDHGALGQKHKDCAERCIKSGLPIGIKSDKDGTTYLIIGQHRPINDKLAKYAAETVAIRGKLVKRDGISMIANAEIVE